MSKLFMGKQKKMIWKCNISLNHRNIHSYSSTSSHFWKKLPPTFSNFSSRWWRIWRRRRWQCRRRLGFIRQNPGRQRQLRCEARGQLRREACGYRVSHSQACSNLHNSVERRRRRWRIRWRWIRRRRIRRRRWRIRRRRIRWRRRWRLWRRRWRPRRLVVNYSVNQEACQSGTTPVQPELCVNMGVCKSCKIKAVPAADISPPESCK